MKTYHLCSRYDQYYKKLVSSMTKKHANINSPRTCGIRTAIMTYWPWDTMDCVNFYVVMAYHPVLNSMTPVNVLHRGGRTTSRTSSKKSYAAGLFLPMSPQHLIRPLPRPNRHYGTLVHPRNNKT